MSLLFISLLAVAGGLASGIACVAPSIPEEERFEGPIMGTQYHVTVVSEGGALAPAQRRELDAAILERLEVINGLMSTYLPDSELSRFNALQSIEPFEVSAPTVEVVREAQRISRWSGGAFDATVGPLVDLWGFGPTMHTMDRVPTAQDVEQQLASVGYEKVVVTSSPSTLRKLDPALELDLSALAKGYAVDQVAQELEDFGHRRYLVEVGGEVRTAGTNASGEPWRIGIERPETGRRELQGILHLAGASLATSGDYRNFYEVEGKRYSHTLDPRTGSPVTHDGASVTVVADRCMTADGYATALLVLGPEEGYRLAVREGLVALFLLYRDGAVVERPTPAFQTLLGTSVAESDGTSAP